jgi:hypothetical protein
MAKMNTRYRYMLDNAPAITLVAKDGVAKTASFNGAAVTLDTVLGHWNDPHYLADTLFAVAVNVDAIDATTGDETYTLALEFGTAGFAQTVRTHTLAVKGPGQYVMVVDAETVMAMLDDVAVVRVAATLAGTTPSITLNAWFAGRPIL